MANIVEEFEKEEESCQAFANQIGAAAYLVGPSRGKVVKNLLNIVSADGFQPCKNIKLFYAAWPKKRRK